MKLQPAWPRPFLSLRIQIHSHNHSLPMATKSWNFTKRCHHISGVINQFSQLCWEFCTAYALRRVSPARQALSQDQSWRSCYCCRRKIVEQSANMRLLVLVRGGIHKVLNETFQFRGSACYNPAKHIETHFRSMHSTSVKALN